MVNKLNVGEYSKKKTTGYSVIDLNEYTLSKFTQAATNYIVLDLPDKIVLKDCYVVVAEAGNAGTLNVIASLDGVATTAALASAVDLTTEAITDGTGVPAYYENGVYILINFGTAVPASGDIKVVVEYLETDKANGELTQVPVIDNFS